MMWAVINVLILRNWLLILTIPAFWVHRDGAWGVIVLASFLIGLDLRGLALNLTSYKSGREALDLVFSREKDGQSLEEVPAANILPWLTPVISKEWPTKFQSPMQNPMLRHKLGLSGNFEKLKIYVRQFQRPPYDHLLKAYTCFNGTSFIFLRDHVYANSKPYERFKLFHEIAHISGTGMAALANSYQRPIAATATVFLALLTCELNWLLISGLFAFLIRELVVWKLFPVEFEVKADLFALSGLNDPVERERALALHAIAMSKEGQPTSTANGYRIYRLKRAMRRIEKYPEKLPTTAAWNNSPSSTGVIWFGLLILVGLHSFTLPFWQTALACAGAIFTEFVVVHPRIFSLAAKVQQEVETKVAVHELRRPLELD